MKKTMTSLAITFLLLTPTMVLAQEEAAEQPEPAWTGDLGLAYLANSGNTDNSSFGLSFKMDRVPDPWGISFLATFDRAEDTGVLTGERFFAGVKGKRALGERWELFAGVSGEQDEFAGYDLLALIEAGATFKALTGPKHLLSFDGGLTYTDEDRVDPNPDVSYAGAVLGLAYEWKISDNAAFTQGLVFFPNFDDSDDWRFNSETAVTAAVSSRLALKFSYDIRYRNQPIGDNDDTDTTTKISLVLKL